LSLAFEFLETSMTGVDTGPEQPATKAHLRTRGSSAMHESGFQVYPYRWIVLLVFMVAAAMNQVLWITFAPITSRAAAFYGVSELDVGMLSMCFMIVYVLVSIPASWVIDTYGIRIGAGTGVALTGVFGLLRGLPSHSYGLVLVAQIGIAVGQPFILNAVTTVAARWFPLRERATASGLGSLSLYLGILLGLVLTPILATRLHVDGMLLVYGVAALGAAVVFFGLARERPPTPPCLPGLEARSLVLDGFRRIFRHRSFLLLLAIFFVGLGAFNAVTTWIEEIVRPRGFGSEQAGLIGGAMIVGGVLGAVVLPSLSDRFRRRKPFMLASIAGAIVGLVGVTWAQTLGMLVTSALVLGFFLLSAGPIGFQYGAEITFPIPEGTSNGLLLMMGQISGILFVLGMDAMKSSANGSMAGPLVGLVTLLVLCLGLGVLLEEPATLLAQPGDAAEGRAAAEPS
jgi:MFS family permease